MKPKSWSKATPVFDDHRTGRNPLETGDWAIHVTGVAVATRLPSAVVPCPRFLSARRAGSCSPRRVLGDTEQTDEDRFCGARPPSRATHPGSPRPAKVGAPLTASLRLHG